MAAEPVRSAAVEGNDPDVEEAYRNASTHVVAEILGGVLMMAPRPASKHARATFQLGLTLGNVHSEGTGAKGGWIFLPEPELELGARPDHMQPDLAGWRLERLPRDPGNAVTVPPDWVCEVLSPSTRAVDREIKMPLYAEHGVGFVWLLDPAERALEAFAREGGGWRARGAWRGDVRVSAAPFDGTAIELARLFAWAG